MTTRRKEKRKLFKSIYGELIDPDYENLKEVEIIEIAIDVLNMFAERYNVDKWRVKRVENNPKLLKK